MANTTNFGWETPDDTDLVKDGAAAMRTLGNSIDASFVDLKGGTSGQILSKNSNTDLDFTWIANDQGDITSVTAGVGLTGGGTAGGVTLTNDMATTITAAGDIVVGTGSGTYDNLPIGTTGQVLTADTTVSPYKVKWATSSAPAFVGCVLTNSVGQAVTTGTYTAVTFDTESIDTDGFHSTSSNTNRITIPSGKGGKYLITAMLTWQSNATGYRIMYLTVNQTQPSASATKFSTQDQGSSTVDSSLVGSIVLDLSAGDWVNLSAYQTSGGNLNVLGNGSDPGITNFTATYLGA